MPLSQWPAIEKRHSVTPKRRQGRGWLCPRNAGTHEGRAGKAARGAGEPSGAARVAGSSKWCSGGSGAGGPAGSCSALHWAHASHGAAHAAAHRWAQRRPSRGPAASVHRHSWMGVVPMPSPQRLRQVPWPSCRRRGSSCRRPPSWSRRQPSWAPWQLLQQQRPCQPSCLPWGAWCLRRARAGGCGGGGMQNPLRCSPARRTSLQPRPPAAQQRTTAAHSTVWHVGSVVRAVRRRFAGGGAQKVL